LLSFRVETTGPQKRPASGGILPEKTMSNERKHSRSPNRERPAMMESLEGRRLMTATPISAPSPAQLVYSVNIVGMSALTQPLPETTVVARPAPTRFYDFDWWW
jgi:hypothetical protein